MADIDEIIGNFAVLDDWDDRYRYLIELGRELPPLAAAAHSDANKVQGCASQVWLDTTVRPNGAGGPVLTFAGDSDAHIVCGLIPVRCLFGQERTKDPEHRCRQIVRRHGFARTSHAAALEWLSFHGGADSLRRSCRVRCSRLAAHGLRSRVSRVTGDVGMKSAASKHFYCRSPMLCSCSAHEHGSALARPVTVRSAGTVPSTIAAMIRGETKASGASRRMCRSPCPSRRAISAKEATRPSLMSSIHPACRARGGPRRSVCISRIACRTRRCGSRRCAALI